VSLSVQKLHGVINLLSDPLQAGNAAFILTSEAKERGVLVADLMLLVSSAPTSSAQTYRPPPPPSDPSPSSPPCWQDVEPIDDDGPYAQRLGQHVGLVSEILGETDKAWLVLTPSRDEAWLAESVVENHGEDRRGRAILVLPKWLARKIGLAP
jgi:hypothetical protein